MQFDLGSYYPSHRTNVLCYIQFVNSMLLVITPKSPRLRESGLLDECALQILRCAQNDNTSGCHPERSEGSMVNLGGITSMLVWGLYNISIPRLKTDDSLSRGVDSLMCMTS